MRHKDKLHRIRKYLNYFPLVAVMFITSIIGTALLISTRAVTPPQNSLLSYPSEPPVRICGTGITSNPSSVIPAGAISVPTGDNSQFFANERFKGATAYGSVYWFEPGVHTLGNNQFGQIEPVQDASYVGAPGAILDGQGINLFVFTQKATGVKIRYLTIQNFVTPLDQGAINGDRASGWVIEYNTIKNNGGAAVFMGDNNIVRYNCLKDNSQYGYQGFGSNILLDRNEISGNNTGDWENKIIGCGCTGAGKFWTASRVTVSNNWVHDNKSVGIWADNNNYDFLIEGNYIEGNDSHGILYETSYNVVIRRNTLIRNTIKQGLAKAGDSFPQAAVYISESGGDSRISYVVSGSPNLEIYENNFVNNWAGVALWENADRFCASPTETSTYTCTLGNPAATLETCAAGKFSDGMLTAGSTTLKSAKATFYPPYDTGVGISGTNIPAGTVISNIIDGNTVTLSKAATGSGSNLDFIMANRSATNAIANQPLYSDCRHQTKNVKVHNNIFNHDPAAIGCSDTLCGRNALFSNGGTYPGWSPYKGTVIQQAVTYNQNNRYYDNTYIGPWRFMAYEPSNNLVMASWQANPYNQDLGSTYDGPPASFITGDSSTFETGTGRWQPWYSSAIERSTETAQSGQASLKIRITGLNGWGVQTFDPGGYAAGPGPKTASFWAKLGSGNSLGASFRFEWLGVDGTVLKSDFLQIAPLTASWQYLTADFDAPVGTAKVRPSIFESDPSAGRIGDYLYVDNLEIVEKASSSTTTLGDVNGDGKVNFDDALGVIRQWSKTDPKADINKDGVVNFDDALIIIRNWKP